MPQRGTRSYRKVKFIRFKKESEVRRMFFSNVEEIYTVIQQSTDPLVVFSKTGIIVLLFYLLFRHLLIGIFFRMVKKIDREVNKSVRRYYFKQSWVGWSIFAISFSIAEILALNGSLLTRYMNFSAWVILILLLMCLSVYYHLYYLTTALIHSIKQRVEIEKQ